MTNLTPSRRTVLTAGAALPAAAALASLFGALPAAAEGSAIDYSALRAAWVDILTGRSEIDASDSRYTDVLEQLRSGTQEIRAQLVTDAARTDVFADAPLVTNAGVLLTARRLRTMATAWVTPGTDLFGSTNLLAEIIAGLRTTNAYGYNPTIEEYGNWWTWEVGASTALATAIIYVWDHMDPADIASYCAALDFYVPDPWYKLQGTKLALGAGRANMCQVGVLRALLDGDTELLEYCRVGLAVSWDLVVSGDGFYADGSFITHDTVAYSGSYGLETMTPLARMFALLGPALGEVADQQGYIDIVDRTIVPIIVRGQVLDSTRGRAISRDYLRSQDAALRAIEDLVMLSRAADEATAQRWLGLCKSWVADLGDSISPESITRVSALRALEASDAVPVAEPEGVRLYGSMDRVVIRRNGWALGIAGASTRIAFYEPGNGENPRGFYTGAGMTTLYNDDVHQYDDDFWPTVDWYRLPGTTSDQLRLPDETGGTFGRAVNPGEWTGGSVVHPDSPGAAVVFAQHVHGLGDTRLRARKAWFGFDGIVVALGSAIRSGSPDTVETIVENRNLHEAGTNELLVDGIAQIPGLNTSRTLHSPRWAHLEGVGGYLFEPDTVLKMKREERTGAWADINIAGGTDSITRRYLTLWIWHGTHPADGTYAYALLPGATPAETEATAQDAPYTVLANNVAAQAVEITPGVRGFAFWEASTVGDIVAHSPGTVVIKDEGRTRTIALTPHGGKNDTFEVSLPADLWWRRVVDDGGASVRWSHSVRADGQRVPTVHLVVPRTSTPQQYTVVLEARPGSAGGQPTDES